MGRGVTAYLVPTEHRRLNEFVGLLLLTVAVLVGLSLISFHPDDPSLSANPRFVGKPANFIGLTGSYVADALFQVLGYSSFLLPIFLGVYAFYWLASWTVRSLGVRLTGMLLMLLTVSASLSVSGSLPRVRGLFPAGGVFGKMLWDILESVGNTAGAVVILIAAFFISLFLATTFSFGWALGVLKTRFAFVSRWAERWKEWNAERAREAVRRKADEKKAPKKQVIASPREQLPKPALTAVEPRRQAAARGGAPPLPIAETAATRAAAAARPATPPAGSTAFPPTTLLQQPAVQAKVHEEELRDRAALLQQKASEFLVDGVVQQIHPGPVVTTYEFKPEAGVKYSRIIGLGDDLCLALEAESVRIDRIPGKSTVGIEVPNNERATIMLRTPRVARVHANDGAFAAGAGKGHHRQDRRVRSATHAAPACGGLHRHRKERFH